MSILVARVRVLVVILSVLLPFPVLSFSETDPSFSTKKQVPSSGTPVEISADRIEYDQEREEYYAKGSVDVTRGSVRLTSDEATLQKLTGALTASGHVHLRDDHGDVWAEQMELNMNTEAGVLTTGRMYSKKQNSFVTGRRIQRFSETHYRIKDGSFTNCDAKDGETPAWRFTFDDIDVEFEDALSGKGVWFNVNDVPLIPLPTFEYPLGATRKSGFLVPNIGIDNNFGFKYQQGYFWAIDPSQDLTISPRILSSRGGGGDLEYRYVWSRQAKGQWLAKTLYDTEENQMRAEFRGSHVQGVNRDLSLRLTVNYSTDRDVLQDFSSSGVQRALPSQESNLSVMQRLNHGALYLWGQYLQPLGDGGDSTFQRLPEVGHRLIQPSLFGSPLLLTMDSTYVYFFREEGFDVNRFDIVPGISLEGLHLGNTLGFRPQFKFREVAYSRGESDSSWQHRETFWVGAEAYTNLSRKFSIGNHRWIRHTIQPNIIYEFVPPTDQSDLVQIDAVDDLIKKSLLTYSVKSRFTNQAGSGDSIPWLDLLFAQSYHIGDPPPLAEDFSDIWGRGRYHQPLRSVSFLSAFNVSVDSFFNPDDANFTQVNSDAFIQSHQNWYLAVGQRYSRKGPRVRRGDIWNPISFNEVLEPADKILYLTTGGGVRLPGGVSVATRWYHDFRTGDTAELDVVALYQNPCRCFSVGLFYIRFPDREQYDFLISLTGLWGSQGNGTQLMKTLLDPIMKDERGVPWDYR